MPGASAGSELASALLDIAEEGDFSGAVVVSRDGRRLAELARGFEDRANERQISLASRFGIASVVKGLTALTVASLVESDDLRLETTLRSLLPSELPLVDSTVTVEHLLGHTSGVGDYLDEEELDDPDDYTMPIPVHLLDRPEAYLPILDGHPQRTPPGASFAYNNGAYVMLSIACERATGRDFYDLVRERVLERAGMGDTAFDRNDRLAGGTALGYLTDGRTNLLHLPVRGAGDGGAYSTVRDLERLWEALFAGRILRLATVDRLVRPRSDVPSEGRRYALGFWLRADRDTFMLEGLDAGISCRTAWDRASRFSYTVISNTSRGAWPIATYLDARLSDLAG